MRSEPSQPTLTGTGTHATTDASGRTFIERARRGQLVEAAIQQLADAGYGQTSLAAVAARAGVSKAAVLYHFAGGKAELLDEVVTHVIAGATAAMSEAIDREETVAGRLRAYIVANVGYLDTHRTQILALIEILTGAPHDADGTPAYEHLGETAVAELAALLAAGQRTGEFGEFSAPVAARSLRGAIDAIAPLLRSRPPADLGAYASQLADLFHAAVTR